MKNNNFLNDYNDVGHPIILEELIKYTNKKYLGYGSDELTLEIKKIIQEKTKQNVDIYLFSGGTQTNMTLISKILKNYEAVISHQDGHINTHETGAVEGAGIKILTVDGKDGKIYPDNIEQIMNIYTENYMVKPKLVYISNSTETGTIYQKEELIALSKICKKYNLLLFLDGARLPVALTSKDNDLTLEDIAKHTDAFYIGGTKNGMPYGELLVIKDEEIKKDFSYHLKNKGAMLSKTFVLAILFKKFLENDYYLTLARQTNETAELLRQLLKENNIEIVYPNATNQIFVKIDYDILKRLEKKYNFKIWNKNENEVIIRLVIGWNTEKSACKELINEIKSYRK